MRAEQRRMSLFFWEYYWFRVVKLNQAPQVWWKIYIGSVYIYMEKYIWKIRNYVRGCLHVKSHTRTSFILVRVVNFIPRLHGRHKYWHRDDAWTKTIMASNEVLLLSMFSFAASAITLANTIANVLLNQMVVRRHNMARATALGCPPLSRCILKKRKIRGKRRFWVKPGRTEHDSKSLFGRGWRMRQ